MRTTARKSALWVVVATMSLPGFLGAQGRSDAEGYFRAVAEFFRVAPDEVLILSEWRLPPDEIPVALYVSRQGGVSADALLVMRTSGRGWFELARRYGLDAGHFHVDMDLGAAGPLEDVTRRYQSLPRARWGELDLQDRDLIGLVNVRVISGHLRVPPARVLAERARAGSYAGAYQALSSR